MIIVFLGMVISHHARAQREGDTWMIGYTQSTNNPDFSVIHLDFTSGNLKLNWDREEVFKFSETAANVCDEDGIPLLWTNGMQVRGKGHINVIDTIAYEDVFNSYWEYWYHENIGVCEGFSVTDGATILPVPSTPDQYYIIYHNAGKNPIFYSVYDWLFSKVEIRENAFETVFKDSLIMPRHKWFASNIKPIRHANGQDWWLIAFDYDQPIYYAFLADKDGIRLHHQGNNEVDISASMLAQFAFSFNGNFLAWNVLSLGDKGRFLWLYAFDRCAGVLSLLDTIHYELGSGWDGVAFSPSERYLFYTIYGKEFEYGPQIWRLDMQTSDIAASATLVGEYDGYLEPEGNEPTNFGHMMQTPDGRIYIIPTSGSSQFMHVIDRPDEEDPDEIRLLQHHISLVVRNGRTAPNIPNFRLGPLDGSPCDTLGIDNLAKSRWRWEPNIVTQPLSIRFTDLSFYEPTAWHWDFGDGQTSVEMHPIHTFPDYGMYYVCQTVSNQYASDSTCQWVEIAPYTSDEEPQDVHTYFVSPNPFNHELSIQSTLDRFTEARISVFDIHGRSVMPSTQLPIPISINFADIPSGMYILKLDIGDQGMQVFKVIKE